MRLNFLEPDGSGPRGWERRRDPVTIGAGITAAAALGGGVMQNASNRRATRASERASAEALIFAKEQEAQRRKEHEEQQALEKAQWEAREARKSEILARYGRSYAPRPYSGGAQASSMAPARPTASGAPQSMTLARLLGGEEPVTTPPLMPPRPPRPPTSLGGMYGG